MRETNPLINPNIKIQYPKKEFDELKPHHVRIIDITRLVNVEKFCNMEDKNA